MKAIIADRPAWKDVMDRFEQIVEMSYWSEIEKRCQGEKK